MTPVVSDPAATAPAEEHGVSCLSPRDPAEKHGASCGRLHCAVCTAHLPNPSQRFCSPRCRSRARSLRKQRLSCPHCGAELWLPRRKPRTQPVPPAESEAEVKPLCGRERSGSPQAKSRP